jgi:rod shape-determining protein MreD
MRNTAFLALGVVLLVLQSNLFRAVDFVERWAHVSGLTPSLLLPLVVFMGVHEYSMARGAALAFTLGYLLDVFAGAPVGLFTFITVATFVVARAAGVRLAAQTLITKFGLAFVFALVQGILIIVLTAIFGNDPARPRALVGLVAPHAVMTAVVSPLIFAAAERIHAATINLPGQSEAQR